MLGFAFSTASKSIGRIHFQRIHSSVLRIYHAAKLQEWSVFVKWYCECSFAFVFSIKCL